MTNLIPKDEMERAEAALAAESFKAFHRFMWGRDMLPHEEWWYRILERQGDDAIIAPPGFWKTTVCQRREAYKFGKEPGHSGLWLMNADEQAARNIGAVQGMINTPRYRKVFPQVIPDKLRGWNKQDCYQKNGPPDDPLAGQRADPTLAGRGITGDYQGMHPHRIIIDDPTKPSDIARPATMA